MPKRLLAFDQADAHVGEQLPVWRGLSRLPITIAATISANRRTKKLFVESKQALK